MELKDRFLRYISFDTQSDENSTTFPSTDKQLVLLRALKEELETIGMKEVTMDEYGYVMATLPATRGMENVPVIGFISHVDTSPDMSGANIKPHIIDSYDGRDILLGGDIWMRVDEFPELKCFKGHTLIHTDGTTLLGADDKAGVAEIVTAMEWLIAHPEVAHGKIRVGFTPDEPYILVRFVAWNASHDIGKKGLDDAGKIALVKQLSKYGRVYVSAEGNVPEELKPHLLTTPYELIHHVLAFAKLVYSEGATMASEAVMLGTHALYVNVIKSGSTQEQSERFHLLYNFNEGEDRYEKATAKAIQLLDEVKESIINAYEIKTGLSRAKLSHLMDAETWMDANKAVELGFADDILKRPGEAEDLETPTVSMLYSKANVVNSLMDKIAAKCAIEPKPTHQHRADDLLDRLNLIKNWR